MMGFRSDRSTIPMSFERVMENRRPLRAFTRYREAAGEGVAFAGIDEYLGDDPPKTRIRRIVTLLEEAGWDNQGLVEAEEPSVRRIARLIPLQRSDDSGGDARLREGFTDSFGRIRGDTARFFHAGGGEEKRALVYRELVRLVQEDPDTRVRRAAARRLRSSFADMPGADFSELPGHRRMFVLDYLDGQSPGDQEHAASLMESPDGEAAFLAARRLDQWGVLGRCFDVDEPGGAALLERASRLGAADYLEYGSIPEEKRNQALQLAENAGRRDIVRSLMPPEGAGSGGTPGRERAVAPPRGTPGAVPRAAPGASPGADEDAPMTAAAVEAVIERMEGLEDDGLKALMETWNTAVFRHLLEMMFPPPDEDRRSVIFFALARIGGWAQWASRAAGALESTDPDIRHAAALCLAETDPEAAAGALTALLPDPVERVRRGAARALAALPSGRGAAALADYLGDSPSAEDEAVLLGLEDAAGAPG